MKLDRKNLLLLLVPPLLGALWVLLKKFDIYVAWQGFSPLQFTYAFSHPELFSHDFPNGVSNFRASSVMLIYPFMYNAFGVLPETLLPFWTGVEIALLGYAMIAVCHFVRPGVSTPVVLVVLGLTVFSHARDMNLARYSQPFFEGQFYNIADALRLFGIIWFLKNRYYGGALFLALAFTVHPTLGVMAVAFVGAALLPELKTLKWTILIKAVSILAVVVVAWIIGGVQGPTSGITTGIPYDEWLSVSRLGSYHWFPVEWGHFTDRHHERFVTFCSVLVLLIHYLFKDGPVIKRDRQLLWAFGAMIIFVVLGSVFTLLAPPPPIIKLSLHRANDLILLLGLPIVVHGLWERIKAGGWRSVIAAVLLISPFIMQPGFPVLWAIMLVWPEKRPQGTQWVSVIGAVTLGLLLVGYGCMGWLVAWNAAAYTGIVAFERLPLFVGLFGAAVLALAWLGTPKKRIVVMSGFVAVMTGYWAFNNVGSYPQKYLQESTAYLEAQRWAAKNTPEDALFMPDPSHYYGWRDFSKRSSFGNGREWLHTAWLYNGDLNAYREGRRRAAELGIEVEPYLGHSWPIAGFNALTKDLRKSYYEKSPAWFQRMRETYGIDYFLFFKKHITRDVGLSPVFENDHVLICAAP